MRVLRELRLQIVPEVDERTLVAHAVAVVRGGEDGDALASVFYEVALVFNLMAADEQLETVVLEEGRGNIRPEAALSKSRESEWAPKSRLLGDSLRCASPISDSPFTRRLTRKRLRVAPEQVTEQPPLRGLAAPLQGPDIIQRHPILAAETAVDDKHLVVDGSGEWKPSEDLRRESIEGTT